jgi:hypothetical protein
MMLSILSSHMDATKKLRKSHTRETVTLQNGEVGEGGRGRGEWGGAGGGVVTSRSAVVAKPGTSAQNKFQKTGENSCVLT